MKVVEGRIYTASDGKTFKRIVDGYIMGSVLDMGVNDTIENYEEVDASEDKNRDIFGIVEPLMD